MFVSKKRHHEIVAEYAKRATVAELDANGWRSAALDAEARADAAEAALATAMAAAGVTVANADQRARATEATFERLMADYGLGAVS